MNDELNETNHVEENPRGLFSQITDHLGSRRDFLSNTAKVGGGVAALSLVGTGTAAAVHEEEPYSDSDYEDQNPNGYGALSDVQIIAL